jgi:putative protease
MKSHTKPEILSPAGNLDKLKFAVNYGADSVYMGGADFNLRSRAGNFTQAEIEEAIDFCKERSVKIIFLMNSFLHEDDLSAAKEYINQIKKHPFDAIMVSDPGMLIMLKEAGITAQLHLSTQMNTLNHISAKFWEDAGFSRIVLGRETSIAEIAKIKESCNIELEIFIHGALCVAYSGRCLLSRYMSGRDANQGDCTQPCRWNYSLVEVKRPDNYLDIIEHAHGTEILSSKDLCMIEHLEELAPIGINAYKIEGRIKSIYHTANTTRIYKDALNSIGAKEFKERMPFRLEELDLISHRPYTDNLFNEFDGMEFSGIPYINKSLFMGCKMETLSDPREALIKIFNPMKSGYTMDAIFPIVNGKIIDDVFTIKSIVDLNNDEIETAIPGNTYIIKFDKDLADYAILRKRISEENI